MTEMKTSLGEALVAALAEMPNPVKNADNPAFKRDGKPLRYADLEATLDACKPVLAAHGIALLQMPVNGDVAGIPAIGVRTVLVGHGEQMDCGEFVLPMEAPNPQKAAGAVTYARRYALTALFGLAQEDDDANIASQGLSRPAEGPPASEKQIDLIYSLAERAGMSTAALLSQIQKQLGKESLRELTGGRGGEASKVIEWLQGKVAARRAVEGEPCYEGQDEVSL